MKLFEFNDININKSLIVPIKRFRTNIPQYYVGSTIRDSVILSAYLVETRRNREEDFDNWYGDYIIVKSSTAAIQYYFNWLTSNGFTPEEARKFECRVYRVNNPLPVETVRQILKKQEEITGERIL